MNISSKVQQTEKKGKFVEKKENLLVYFSLYSVLLLKKKKKKLHSIWKLTHFRVIHFLITLCTTEERLPNVSSKCTAVSSSLLLASLSFLSLFLTNSWYYFIVWYSSHSSTEQCINELSLFFQYSAEFIHLVLNC